MKDAIEMAREVKAIAYTNRHYPDRTTYTVNPKQLKAFEALVRADEREAFAKIQFESILQAIKIEREACANVCEEGEFMTFGCAAEAIRARGNT
jgi:hypothetical protein